MIDKNKINKRFIIVIFMTVITAIVVFKINSINPIKNEKLFSFPMNIGKWTGKEIEMEDWVFESLETPYAILRDYRSPEGKLVNLAITWYDDREIAFHAPEACLGGVGNTIKETTTEKIKLDNSADYEIGRIIAEKNERILLVFYYFISDGYITSSQAKLRIHILFKRLMFKRATAAFVRLMIFPENNNLEDAKIFLKDFLKTSYPLVLGYTNKLS